MAAAATNELFLEVYGEPEKGKTLNSLYSNYNTDEYGSLQPEQLQVIYERLRDSTLSIPQIEASMKHVCSGYPDFHHCDEEELLDVLQEMDRRCFLAKDLQWEFTMLDRKGKGSIAVQDAMFLFKMVHGDFFSTQRFSDLMSKRIVKDCDVTFEEIEVELCNIPTYQWIKEQRAVEKKIKEKELREIAKAKEEQELIRIKEEEAIRAKQAEIERLKKEEEIKIAEENKRREIELQKLKDEEDAKLAEEKKRREIELQKLKDEEEAKLAEEEKRREIELQKLKEEEEIKLAEERERKELELQKLKEEEELKLAEQKRIIQEEAERKAEEERLLEEQQRLLAEENERKAEEDRRLQEEAEQKELQRLKDEEEEKLKQEEMQRKLEEEEKNRLAEEEKEKTAERARENWKRLKDLAVKQLLPDDLQALREMKTQREAEEAVEDEGNAEAIAQAEDSAEEDLSIAEEMIKNAGSEEEREKAKQAREKAAADLLKNKEKRLRLQLGAAVKLRNRPKLHVSIEEAKESKIKALKPDIGKAEKVADSIKCGEDLEDAMAKRQMPLIEEAITAIKSKSYEKEHVVKILEAEKLVEKLKRLEKSKKDILELNQRTIAIIRSYSKPLPAIHDVMIGTYMILGYKEKELKEWKFIQALLGRTGKESLKRMCTTLEASKVDLNIAKNAEKRYFNKHTLESITDISAGVGTFYAWSTTMIEEARNWLEDGEFRKAIEEKRKLEMEETKSLQKKRKEKKKK